MTTDITELAQSLKAAAVRAKTATEEYASGHMSVSVCFAECEEFNRLTDGPDNILALVEALEKAQAQSSKWLEAYHKAVSIGARYEERIAELESRTVKLPKPISVLHRREFTAAHCAIYAYPEAEVNAALAAAGIKVEVE
ncbi:hypothetical protein [Klebsiella pneumoniae]|uniref:hypothetical protein n=1 Tax=Klebsiella pneumoniae TaxID=573 RepID=UPI001D00B8BC|nr:hypothetical protein [Klebsiella pneumoniae]MCF1883123.1 hypothetical protein [Klebsiella pneumoniae]